MYTNETEPTEAYIMKGYITQYADYNLILNTSGDKVDTDKLLKEHAHADEIAELIGHKYRPENLHNNGDIDDSFTPSPHNMARVTHEITSVNKADLCEQASFKASQWSHLATTYQQYVKRMIRWRDGYQPEPTEHDKSFMLKVEAAKQKMRRNRKYAQAMRRKYTES